MRGLRVAAAVPGREEAEEDELLDPALQEEVLAAAAGRCKGENMKALELIKASGITQREIAEQMGTSPTQLGNVLHGRRPFPIKWIEPLCRILNCEPNELFGYEKKYHQVTVIRNDGEVIAVVTEDKVVELAGYRVILA